MLGSSNSIACANIMLNSAVAESLKIYADKLEKTQDFETALHEERRPQAVGRLGQHYGSHHIAIFEIHLFESDQTR